MIGYIYEVTNKKSGKRYIGKKHSSVFDLCYFGSGLLIKKAVKKYGKENFSVEILCWCQNVQDLNEKERHFILTKAPEYNLAPGGDGGSIIESLENREEIYERRTASIKSWHSRMSPEQKENWIQTIRQTRKGNFRNGYVPTDEHREKSSRSNKAAWQNRDTTKRRKNHAAAMILRRGKQTHNSIELEIDGKVYPSLTQAANALGVVRQTLKNRIQKGQIKCSLIEKQ